jgi:hypothetical protein
MSPKTSVVGYPFEESVNQALPARDWQSPGRVEFRVSGAGRVELRARAPHRERGLQNIRIHVEKELKRT